MSQSEYSRDQIDQWHEQLTELAQKPRTAFTKKQAVEALMDPIEEALQAHSYQTVAGRLQQWGLDISPGSLKQYVIRYRREQESNTSRKRKGKSKRTARVKASESDGKSRQPVPVATAEKKMAPAKVAKVNATRPENPLPVSTEEDELEKEFNL